MKLASILRKTEKLAIDNSPLILTVIGVAGTVATALLTHKATLKAHAKAEDFIIDLQTAAGPAERIRATNQELLRETWTCYIPPVAMGTLTIAAIVSSNRISTKRAAALAAAYTISEQAMAEYKEQVAKKFGEAKAQEVKDDVAKRRMDQTPMNEQTVVVTGRGDVLCFDQWSGRYFNGNVEEIKKAVNEVNFYVNHNGYASLSDFYDQLALPRTQESEEVGWTADRLLEVDFSTHLSDDGRPCVSFSFQVHPVRGFHAHG